MTATAKKQLTNEVASIVAKILAGKKVSIGEGTKALGYKPSKKIEVKKAVAKKVISAKKVRQTQPIEPVSTKLIKKYKGKSVAWVHKSGVTVSGIVKQIRTIKNSTFAYVLGEDGYMYYPSVSILKLY